VRAVTRAVTRPNIRAAVAAGGGPTLQQALAALLGDGQTLAYYQKAVGVTGTANVSAWANQIGIAGPLVRLGATGPVLQADGTLLFSGANYMEVQCVMAQPYTIYFVGKHITYTGGAIMDAGTVVRGMIEQYLNTPELSLYANGGRACTNAGFALNTYGILTAVFAGAASSLRVNETAAVAGNPGIGPPTGITLGGRSGSSSGTNIQVRDVIVRSGSDAAGTQTAIRAALKAIHGTP